MTGSSEKYVGCELDLFARATVWKRYLSSELKPYVGGVVLEVGAGIGKTTRFLCSGGEEQWLCLEPDAELAERIRASIAAADLPLCCETQVGTLADLGEETRFETILYVDVLEHICDDRSELHLAAGHLRPGGRLIVVAPAHPRLFSRFDASVGHFRRYTRTSLAALVPASCRLQKLIYLDSVGLLAPLGNRLLLRRPVPTAWQIALWDKAMVRCSRLLDPLLGYRLGKSLLGVWQKKEAAATAEGERS